MYDNHFLLYVEKQVLSMTVWSEAAKDASTMPIEHRKYEKSANSCTTSRQNIQSGEIPVSLFWATQIPSEIRPH